MAKSLTSIGIKALKPPSKRQEIPYGHEKARGLYIVIQPSGKMAWAFRYEFAGRSRKLTLGAYPGLSLPAAREAVAAARRKLANGIDPGAEKTEAGHKPTVAGLCAKYREWAAEGLKPNTLKENLRYAQMLETSLGRKFVDDIT